MKCNQLKALADVVDPYLFGLEASNIETRKRCKRLLYNGGLSNSRNPGYEKDIAGCRHRCQFSFFPYCFTALFQLNNVP
ncbi:MAG: hypothetical protein ABFR35_09290, partial [Thermodesulfobacteriota bacterium]